MGEAGGADAAALRAGTVGPPALPGVYAFRDAAGGLLYVGTSRSLARRVPSYFAACHPPASKCARIARLAARVQWRTMPSVIEALVLEARTIRRERPHFNRRLKQVGHHVYVGFDARDPFPRLEVTREPDAPGWRYVGPFPGARATQAALAAVVDAVGLRTCPGALHPDPAGRACLRLDLGQCCAPCVARTGPGSYGRQLARALAALGGSDPEAAHASGARAGQPLARTPSAVAAALTALRAARRAVRVIACVPASGAPGHRVLALAGGRLRAAEPLPHRDHLAGVFARVLRTLAPPPPLVLPREDVAEVRIVTAWLASPDGQRSAVDVDRIGRRGALAWIEARLAPGPLFTTAGR